MTQEELELDWIPQVRETSPYRVSIYTSITYDGVCKETNQGYAIYLKQFRKDFYKPKNFIKMDEGFFALERTIKDSKLNKSVLREVLNEVYDNGFILDFYELKRIRTICFIRQEELDYLESNPKVLGHIIVSKHDEPLYDTQRPLEAIINGEKRNFYYSTRYSRWYKPDEDTRDYIKREVDIEIDMGSYDVLSIPVEPEVLIKSM